MSVSGVAGWMNLKGLSLELDLPDELYSGVETMARITLRNRKGKLPSFLLRTDLSGPSTCAPLLRSRSAETLPVLLTPGARGKQSIPEIVVSSPFPVNFFVRSRGIALDGSFVVFPKPRPAPGGSAPGLHLGSAASTRGHGGDGELHSIVSYTGVEPLKSIHWRLSARQEELLVKRFTAAAAPPVVIDPDELPGGNLEERLSSATFLVNRLMRDEQSVGLRLGPHLVPPERGKAHRLALLSQLALYGLD